MHILSLHQYLIPDSDRQRPASSTIAVCGRRGRGFRGDGRRRRREVGGAGGDGLVRGESGGAAVDGAVLHARLIVSATDVNTNTNFF